MLAFLKGGARSAYRIAECLASDFSSKFAQESSSEKKYVKKSARQTNLQREFENDQGTGTGVSKRFQVKGEISTSSGDKEKKAILQSLEFVKKH
jgi:hypothetical protein